MSAHITEDCSTSVQPCSFSHTRTSARDPQINLLSCHPRHTRKTEAVLNSRLNCSLNSPFPQGAKHTCKSPSSSLWTLKHLVKEMFKELCSHVYRTKTHQDSHRSLSNNSWMFSIPTHSKSLLPVPSALHSELNCNVIPSMRPRD